MRIETHILIFLLFIGQFAFGQEAVERIIHQPDSLLETSNYTIYKGDTFNIKDKNEKIQGKGIWIIKDESVVRGIRIGPCDDCKISNRVWYEAPTNVYYIVRQVFYGQFQDNLMHGIWTCLCEDEKRRVELTFEKGIIQGQVKLYFDTGELMYSGTAIAGQDKIELKKFTKGGLQAEIIKWRLSDITELYF